jgi:CheY-like chemotaxis protein
MTATAVEILLVEDNPDDEKLISGLLRKYHPGIYIECVQDTDTALAFLFNTGKYSYRSPESSPKLILLDLGLPKGDGREFIRVAKSYLRTRSIPVVVFTGSDDENKMQESYELGANGYVVKPFDHNKLKDVIQRIGDYWISTNLTSSRSPEAPYSEA